MTKPDMGLCKVCGKKEKGILINGGHVGRNCFTKVEKQVQEYKRYLEKLKNS